MNSPKTDSLTVRIDRDLKVEAEEILSSLGLRTSDTIRTLYKLIVLHQGLPYDLRIPNEETIQALAESNAMSLKWKNGEDVNSFDTVEDMFADLVDE